MVAADGCSPLSIDSVARMGTAQKTMPWCFRPQYGLRIVSIIDCFELFIEKPGDLMSKAMVYLQTS